ncbi:MAG: glycosyltransferase [Bacteroides sp.]|nr:glycosyltransferase [Bacteroides sp.]
MRILYFFQELGTPMFQWQRSHIIDELSRHDCIVEVFNPLLFDSPEEANEALLKRIEEGNINLFFTNVCYERMLFEETIKRIRSKGIPSLCLRCDNLVIPYNDKNLAPYFDLVWLTSRETKHIYDNWGVNTIFAPYAANPFTFKYTPQNIERKVSFIGTPYGSRPIMINALTCNGIDVDAFWGSKLGGHNLIADIRPRYNIIQPSTFKVLLNRLRFKEGRLLLCGTIVNKFLGEVNVIENNHLTKFSAIPPRKISSYYSKYALSLASTSTNSTDVLRKPLKIVNLRNFEIPMSGGIEICKYNPELAEYFVDGKEILFYNNNEELIEKARYYTQRASDKEILDIKIAARRRAEREHTWWNRFCLMFERLGIECS